MVDQQALIAGNYLGVSETFKDAHKNYVVAPCPDVINLGSRSPASSMMPMPMIKNALLYSSPHTARLRWSMILARFTSY